MLDGRPRTPPDAEEIAPYRLLAPERPFAPVVFTSAHSGRAYSPDLMSGVRLCPLSLRRSEDCFVDELFAAAPEHGAPLLAANFPRAFCDANREAWELDPAMFTDPLPDWVNTTSSRVSAGLGTIAKVVASGEPIYAVKLPFSEAERRIYTYWRPYHDMLAPPHPRYQGSFRLLSGDRLPLHAVRPIRAGGRRAARSISFWVTCMDRPAHPGSPARRRPC